MNTFFIFGNEFISFNDARIYLNTIDKDAWVIYQSGTDDLWDYNSTHTFIRSGYGLKQVLNAIEENKNKTIYLVEYPKPWVTTVGEVENITMIQSINYWPIEVHIYVYTGNKPFDQSKEYSYYPKTGIDLLYYTYADEEKSEKVFLEGKIILGKERILIVIPNSVLRTLLSPLTKIKVKGRSIVFLEAYNP